MRRIQPDKPVQDSRRTLQGGLGANGLRMALWRKSGQQ